MNGFFSERSKPPKGIGASDILVGFVVAAILAIIFYNIHLKLRSSREVEYVDSYLSKNSSLALKAITEDLLNSMVYAWGCKSVGLLKPRYGGIEGSDGITILAGSPFSTAFLKEDMRSETSDISLELGASFQTNQRLAICNDGIIEWFKVDRMSHSEKRGVSIIMPAKSEEGFYIANTFPKDSVVTALDEITYFIRDSQEARPNLYKRSSNSQETLIANDIESLKFEYTLENSIYTEVDPSNPADINGIRITVVARSNSEDDLFQGTHSLSGAGDGYKRLEVSSSVPFKPADKYVFKEIAYRISTDNDTGEDFPLITKPEPPAQAVQTEEGASAAAEVIDGSGEEQNDQSGISEENALQTE